MDHADALTRVYRGHDVAHLMMTHSLDDLAALPTEADQAKARGFIDRCAITVLAGLPRRELDEVARIVPLSDAEKQLVTSWSSPETWQPGRGEYLLKTGQRIGMPVELHLVGDEAQLYDTDNRPERRPGRPSWRTPVTARSTANCRSPSGAPPQRAAVSDWLTTVEARRGPSMGAVSRTAGETMGHHGVRTHTMSPNAARCTNDLCWREGHRPAEPPATHAAAEQASMTPLHPAISERFRSGEGSRTS